MKKILVTGGAGFIGSNFIRYYLAAHRNCRIVNLDKLTYCGNPANLKGLGAAGRYAFVRGDIADRRLVERLVAGCAAVVNFAAETHVDRSIRDAADFVRTNVVGTHTLLEAVKKHGTKRFIQVSTDEVYGSIEAGSFGEDDPLKPNSPYSATKAAADLLARSYYTTYGLPVIITRSSNNFGPYQYPEKVIPLFVTNLLEGKKVPLYADGKNMRDWLFVADNCEAIDAVMRQGEPGGVYNIGTGTEITNLELTHALLRILGKGRDRIQFVKDRPGHDKRYSLDVAKVKALGWRPRHRFEAALALTVDWYRRNESWWRDLTRKRQSVKYW